MEEDDAKRKEGNKGRTVGGRRQAVDGLRSVDPMLECRLVGSEPTDRQVAGDRWMLDDGDGRPLVMALVPITLSERRRPARDWATRR